MEVARKPSPILVIGKNRSGTKWVSNLLANHSSIRAVQAPQHGGIIETNFFGMMQQVFGDIGRVENYIAAVEAWAQSDFFKASGYDKATLYTERPLPASYLELFERVMSELAIRHGASFWLQKTSPLQAEMVLEYFSACRLVLVSREMNANLESSIKLSRDLDLDDSVARATFRHVLETKLSDRIRARREVVEVQYEALRHDTPREVERICSALGIPYEPSMLDLPWTPNTSFRDGNRASFRLTPNERRTISAVAGTLKFLPTSSLVWLRGFWRNRDALFVRGSYREIARHYDLG